jgi:hypothetical protein
VHSLLRRNRAGTLLRLLPIAPLLLFAILLPGPRQEPSLRATAATGNVTLVNSRGGGAIVSAAHMDPGDSVSGTVTISNTGDAPAGMTLSKSQLQDTPGAGGGRLSDALFLAVDDVSGGRRVYDGPLADMPALALEPIPAGRGRQFQFTVRLPKLRGDTYMVAATSVRFDWTAKAVQKPAPRPHPDTRPPALKLSGERRQLATRRGLVVYALCDEPCSLAAKAKVRGVKGVRAGKATPRLAGASARRRVAISVTFGRKGLRRLRRPRRGARVLVAVTARDRAGNATVSRRTIRLRPARWPGGRPGGGPLVGGSVSRVR